MRLKDYIEIIMESCQTGKEIEFNLNLTADCLVADYETGNTIRFTLEKGDL